MSQMVRESKPEVPWHQLLVEIGTGEVAFLTELIVVYLENSSCWSKVTASLISHPYHQEFSLDSLPWISLEKAHLPWDQVYAFDTPSLKQPYPYLPTNIIFHSSFSGNRDGISYGRISSWKAL